MTFPLRPLSHLQTQSMYPPALTHSSMAVTKPNPPPYYYTLLSPRHEKNYVILASYHPQKDVGRRLLIYIVILLLLAALGYTLWPSDPKLKITRLSLKKIRMQFQSFPVVKIELLLLITVNVRNVNAYPINYTQLEVGAKYRGKKLGHVQTEQGRVGVLASSDVDVELEFTGFGVLSDMVALFQDLVKGELPFDTVTEVTGAHGFLFLKFPLQVKTSCEVLVDTNEQIIVHQTCYPKG